MQLTITDDFDLDKIARSGQCFRVQELADGTFRFVTGAEILYIKQTAPTQFTVSCDETAWDRVWTPYFNLGRDYRAVRRRIPAGDEYMHTAAAEGAGIRILKQDPWEMLVTFIISQRKSIPAIRQSVELLARRYGTPVCTGREELCLFPSPEQLREAGEEELKACKLGYRVPYVQDAVNAVLTGRLDLADLAAEPDEALYEALKTVRGVGTKVANCVCLFAYGRTAMAPVDTWISKIIDAKYQGSNPFPAYGADAGIMQQFAFFSAQSHKKEGGL